MRARSFVALNSTTSLVGVLVVGWPSRHLTDLWWCANIKCQQSYPAVPPRLFTLRVCAHNNRTSGRAASGRRQELPSKRKFNGRLFAGASCTIHYLHDVPAWSSILASTAPSLPGSASSQVFVDVKERGRGKCRFGTSCGWVATEEDQTKTKNKKKEKKKNNNNNHTKNNNHNIQRGNFRRMYSALRWICITTHHCFTHTFSNVP